MLERTPHSLRLLVLALVGFSLTVFTVVLLTIFYTTMPKMLLQSESRYLARQLAVVEDALRMAMHHTYVMADDMGIREDATLFALGEYPDYISRSWPDASILETYRFNFVVFRGLDGNVLYQDFYDYANGRAQSVPEGFIQYLDTISNEVLDMYKRPHSPDLPVDKLGRGGIIFYDQVPYFVAAMPIMRSRAEGSPAGTVILGSILNEQYFRGLTHSEMLDFTLIPASGAAGEAGKAAPRIETETSSKVSMTLPFKDIEGNSVLLRMSDSRIIYQEGMGVIVNSTIMLLLVMLLFGMVVYRIAVRIFLRPLEYLVQDINSIAPDTVLDAGKYAKSKELVALSTSINDMLQRLNQSRISIGVLRRILNGLDVYLYVSDLDTDEFLFVNDKMAAKYGLGKDTSNQTCFSSLKPGTTARCAFCPKPQLIRAPDKVIVWENYHAETQQYLRSTDCLIEWTDKRLVHLHHAVDITNIKTAEATLKKRLEQQELMSAISQTFISVEDTAKLILNALDTAGKFMDVSKILVSRRTSAGDALSTEYGWYNENHKFQQPEQPNLPFAPGTVEYDGFITDKLPCLVYDDVSGMERFVLARAYGIKSIISIPVHLDNAFWGVLSFCSCEQHRNWSDSDIQLSKMISSIISAVITRNDTEMELARMSSIVNSSPQYISFINAQGGFEYFNQGAVNISGYQVEELKRGGLDMLFAPEVVKRIWDEIIPQIMDQGRAEFELPLRRKDGGVRIMSFSSFKTDFKPVGIGSIALDITEKRRLEKELLVAKEQAEQSSLAKSEFLSRMSHEMRTPLNAIIGMTAIAKAAPDLDKKEYCLEKIDDASSHLLGVINDILDMSKIEASKFELSFTEFNFEKMILRVINVVNFRVDEKNQNLIIHVDPDVPAFIISDEQRLTQIITNLLSNAVKFTPEQGTISVSISKQSDNGEECVLKVEVSDTGIGIAKEQLDKVFRSFEQADGGIARKFGGTGLGLAISKSIVELMGGRIWVESELDKGSRFLFTIRVKKGEQDRRALGLSAVNWQNMRVLVVDDAFDVREYFLTFAQSVGFDCAVAASGEEACELIERNKDDPFNIVFVDWKMPGMNGIELTRRIKEDFGANVVVIMISATQWSDISDEARAAGVDRFLAKPLFSSLIVDCINECLGGGQAEPSPTQHAAQELADEENLFAGRRVLLAEDVDINREIVVSLLQHTGVVIDSAENGREVVEMFKADPGLYDMIFMDIHMPEVDGYEATRLIRGLDIPQAKTVPIVAMTANVFREELNAAWPAA